MPFREISIPGTMCYERIEITDEEDRILRYGGTVSKNVILMHLLTRAKLQHISRVHEECRKQIEEYQRKNEET